MPALHGNEVPGAPAAKHLLFLIPNSLGRRVRCGHDGERKVAQVARSARHENGASGRFRDEARERAERERPHPKAADDGPLSRGELREETGGALETPRTGEAEDET
ncbi:MAG TPA: hypothetical protein VJ921_12665, partial [Vicinamibacteria bacterium]|nr:hypothetical protein [Vicinamibacteria bacterium]